MRRTRVAVFLHIVWATWDRTPLLVGETERRVYRCIEASCAALGAETLALGGMEDHVHLLVQLPATLAVADLVKQVKGASAHLATHEVAPDHFFKWQGGYAAFSVGQRQLPAIHSYITHQKEHHSANTLIPGWEEDAEAHGE